MFKLYFWSITVPLFSKGGKSATVRNPVFEEEPIPKGDNIKKRLLPKQNGRPEVWFPILISADQRR